MAALSDRWEEEGTWLELLREALAHSPISRTHPSGVQEVTRIVQRLLEDTGFEVQRFANPARDAEQPAGLVSADVLVATRSPRQNGRALDKSEAPWVGLVGHVDVEIVKNPDIWVTRDPMAPTLHEGRIICRGVADNLGPLLQRLLMLRRHLSTTSPGILWVIHGEEEIGSPFPHHLYQTLPSRIEALREKRVRIWIEETGYFLKNGDQRVLLNHEERDRDLVDAILAALKERNDAHGRGMCTVSRYLNKGFGKAKCPGFEHLVCPVLANLVDGSVPYIAIGPNDVSSKIHTANESLPVNALGIAAEQFVATLQTVMASRKPARAG